MSLNFTTLQKMLNGVFDLGDTFSNSMTLLNTKPQFRCILPKSSVRILRLLNDWIYVKDFRIISFGQIKAIIIKTNPRESWNLRFDHQIFQEPIQSSVHTCPTSRRYDVVVFKVSKWKNV